MKKKRNTAFVQVELHGKVVYIRKSTAIWLFQDAERVSSDRIFRVRAKQPQSTSNEMKPMFNMDEIKREPIVAEHILIGDVCAFQFGSNFSIGRILQFAKHDKSKQGQYKGNYANTSDEGIGVLCTWYDLQKTKKNTYTINTSANVSNSQYYSISKYICTLTKGCFNGLENNTEEVTFQASFVELGKEFTIHQECFDRILMTMQDNELNSLAMLPSHQQSSKQAKKWINIEKLILSEKERHILVSGQRLNDILINAALKLLKKQLGHITGLQCPLYQLTRPLPDYKNFVQIIHLQNEDENTKKRHNVDHWSVLSTMDCVSSSNDLTCMYYDSAYSTLPYNCEEIISHLLTTSSSCFKIKVNIMPTPRQTGFCGLYAIAISTALAHNINPSTLIFQQNEMRQHLLLCLENKKLEPFPVAKKKN